MNKIIRSPIVQSAARVLTAKSKVKHGIATDKTSAEPVHRQDETLIQDEDLRLQQSVALASEQLRELEATLEQEKMAAKHEGFESGYAEGKTKAYAELQDKIELLSGLLTELNNHYDKVIKQQEAMLLQVIMTAVNKIVGEVSQFKDVTRNIIDNVVQEVIEKQSLLIKVSPEDYDWLVQETFPEYPGMKFVADESIKWGGCEVETMGGVIDGRLERQLQAFNKSLLDMFRKRQGSGNSC